ncbi:MAG: ribosome-binding factor A [Actinobacteria bacterium HGW-Actinobacteria-7]|nr:MAG: ribosome-binding factor A [Actinobacteria bacterium HGW-Actinobacteria-7]
MDEKVREAVAEILAVEVSDPRLMLVTVTGAKVSPDRSVASVYVSASPERYEEVLAGLESARGRVRSMLGRSVGWRVTPELRFFIDESVDAGAKMAEALTHIPPTLVDGEGAQPSVDEDEEV